MTARRCMTLAALGLLAGCATAPEAPSASPATSTAPPAVRQHFDAARTLFNGERARATVAFMDQYFRLPGNAGFDASIRHVEEILKDAGYVEESAAPAGTRLTYRIERRPLRRPSWEPLDASVTVLGEAAPVLRYASNRNMLAINSASTPDTGVVAQVVDVGAGTPADFERVDVRGSIVLADGSTGQVYTQAARRGAIGVMAYRMPSYTQPEKHRNSIQFGSINDTTGTGWGIILSNDAMTRLRAAVARGDDSVRVITAARSGGTEELTLVADVHGTTQPQERFVLTAHVQEPGANDNASGVAVQAEIARVIAQLIRDGRADPERTITMVFGNEISQTQNYLAADSVRTRGVLWGLSLDMVGQDTEKTGGTFLIEKMPDPSAIWTRGEDRHSEWGGSPLTKERLRPHYLNDFLLARALDQSAATGWVVRTNPFEGGSDHVPFLQHGRPGVLFWHFTDVFYHTDGDRLVNVSPITMSNVGATTLASVLTLTSADAATARALVAEVERAAMDRLRTETALGRAALAAGGDHAHELDILVTWRDYYVAAIESMHDIEVGGPSPETARAISAAARRVRAFDPTAALASTSS